MPVSILMPCKSLRDGKSRLSVCLDGAARYALCRRLLENALRCASALATPEMVWLVTADAEAAAIARRHSIEWIADAGLGLNAALEHARSRMCAEIPVGGDLVILPIDLPFVEPHCITNALAQSVDIVIAPDESGTGTNMLALRSSAARQIPFAFGSGSCASHVALARANGLTIATVRDWRLAFDLDGPAQYARWRARQNVEWSCAIDR